jgi:hypothetical protein
VKLGKRARIEQEVLLCGDETSADELEILSFSVQQGTIREFLRALESKRDSSLRSE